MTIYSVGLYNKLNISVGSNASVRIERATKSYRYQQQYKKKPKAKLERNKKKRERSSANSKQETKEGKTYEPGISLQDPSQSNEIVDEERPKKRARKSKAELESLRVIKCQFVGCEKAYINSSGLKQHMKKKHTQ